jgi:transglutaminase-like putative cysteine protease
VRYQIIHKTVYDYDNPVSVSHHLVRMTPRELPRQHFLQREMLGEPKPTLLTSHEDYFGNTVTFITVEEPHRRLLLTAKSEVEVTTAPPPAPESTPSWESVRELCLGSTLNVAREACEFAFPSTLVPRSPEYANYAAESFPAGRPLLDAALHLMGRIHKDFKFDAKATTVATPLEQVFRQRRGVCQDFAHLQIACLRSLGLSARYVSGYLETLPPPGKPKLIGADASHAWLQVWCGEAGWIDIDPTNNTLPGERYITLAWGRDYTEVSPLRGVLSGSGRHQLNVAVDVLPLPPKT